MTKTEKSLDEVLETDTLLKECDETKENLNEIEAGDDSTNINEESRFYWSQAALFLCSISVILQLVIGVVILVFAILQRSSGGLGLAVNSLLDVLTTSVVIWRYGCEYRNNKKGDEMERMACVFISVLFIISGIAIEAKACFNLSRKWIPYFEPRILLPIEITTAAIYGILVWAKIFISRKLGSRSLFVDGVNTGCGFLMAIMQLVSILVYHVASLWFLDSMSALVIALFLFIFGIRLLTSSTKK